MNRVKCRSCGMMFSQIKGFEKHDDDCCSAVCFLQVGVKPFEEPTEKPKFNYAVWKRQQDIRRLRRKAAKKKRKRDRYNWVRQNKAQKFYRSKDWRQLRYKVLTEYGTVCMLCKCSDKPVHVDHIKPLSKYPQLALEFSNLQVLCEDCNIGKSNKDETDFR